MNAPFPPIGVASASAYDDRAVCPDCGSAAQGSGMFGRPYCGLCYRSIPEFVPLAPVTRTAQGWGA